MAYEHLSSAGSGLYMKFRKPLTSAQGIASWNDRAFILYDTGACAVYDLKNRRVRPLDVFPLGSYNWGKPDLNFKNHANSCNFSHQHWEGNPIPLLYVTIGTGIGGGSYWPGGYGASSMGYVWVPDWESEVPGKATRLEFLCAGPFIEKRLNTPGYVPEDSYLASLPKPLTCRQLGEGARLGDAFCCAELDRVAQTFSYGLADMLALAFPDRIVVGGGVAKLVGTETIACSATNLWQCLINTISFGVKEEDVIRACTYNPACALGVQSEVGSIATGKVADFVVCSPDYTKKRVYLAGKLI